MVRQNKKMPLQPELTVNPEAYNTDRPSFTRFDFKLTGEEWKSSKLIVIHLM